MSKSGPRQQRRRHTPAMRDGHTTDAADEGRPAARAVPVSKPTVLDRLIAEGRVTPARTSSKDLPQPLATAGTVSDLVIEQRW